jgi:hypothetical protein
MQMLKCKLLVFHFQGGSSVSVGEWIFFIAIVLTIIGGIVTTIEEM